MQQPALLAGHMTLPSSQPLNVGVAHVMRQQPTSSSSSKKNKQHQLSTRYVKPCRGRRADGGAGGDRLRSLHRRFPSFRRNLSAYEVSSSSSQAMLSPQRSKRVKENTPPRCAVVQGSSASGSSTACGAPLSCGGWTEPASSTTRDHQQPPRQTIVIPDTPSPAVSIITISSDTDEEDDHKQADSSTMSKQRKNVISCVTVHDSPDSDCSSNGSPYALEPQPANSNAFDSKGAVLDTCCNGNPRTIIIPPLKTQSSEPLAECERLLPDTAAHQNAAYKFKPSSGTAGSGHSAGGASGGGSYRQQRTGPHPFQQQPLNLSQAQPHMAPDRNGGHRRQQAYIAPTIAAQAPYSFHHTSPSHTAAMHPHLAATHLSSQPHLYTYPAPAALGSTGAVAHLVASQGSVRHAVPHSAYPPAMVPVSMGHRVLPSPTLHHSQYQAQFAHQTYISTSPGSAVYTGYPLSPTKVNQYPYL
ncbi:hypothetical protein Z043-102840 [Arapaima gigas]